MLLEITYSNLCPLDEILRHWPRHCYSRTHPGTMLQNIGIMVNLHAQQFKFGAVEGLRLIFNVTECARTTMTLTAYLPSDCPASITAPQPDVDTRSSAVDRLTVSR